MLCLEGDVKEVLRAVVRQDPGVKVVYPGGGVAGANSTGYATAKERLFGSERAPCRSYATSVGGCNAVAEAFGMARFLAPNYYRSFCTTEFIRDGVVPWFTGKKVSIDFYWRKLRELMDGMKPYHEDNEVTIGVTNFETAEPDVLKVDLNDLDATLRAVKATAYMPCSETGFELIGNVPYTDGAIASPLPVFEAVDEKTTALLVVMTHKECSSESWARRWGEYVLFGHVRKLPTVLRKAVYDREEYFREQLAAVRENLMLEIGVADRKLPPTLLVSPSSEVDLIEQDRKQVRRALNCSRRDWEMLLSQTANELTAAA